VASLFLVIFSIGVAIGSMSINALLCGHVSALAHPMAMPLSACLLGVATFGGMFVVPLYAFLTTTVEKCEAARTVAANNIVNSGMMVVGSVIAIGLTIAGLSVVKQLLLVALLCLPLRLAGVETAQGMRRPRLCLKSTPFRGGGAPKA
jgi:hypothetical protein